MSPIESLLHRLGLENLEAKVYLAALGIGTTPASSVASVLKIPRSTARYTCEQLVEKGLMIETKRANTKLFTPENPTKLSSLLYDEERNIKEKRNELMNAMQSLQKMYNPYTVLPDVTFYEGVDGVMRMLEESSKESGTVYTFGAGDYFLEKNPELVRKFRNSALQMNRDIYILRAEKYRNNHPKEREKNYHTKYFKGIDELKVDIQIRDETIGITSISNNAPIGIHVKHKEIAEELQKIFKEMWQLL